MATRPPVGMPKLTPRSRLLLILGGVVLLVMVLGSRLLGAYVDWLWFGEVQAREVFTTRLFTQVTLFVLIGLFVGGAVAASLTVAYRARPVFVPITSDDDPLARYRSTVVARVRMFGIGIPVFVGILAGATAQSDWELVQLFLNGTPFGQVDPEFGHDLGFYVFELPFYNWLLGWLFVAVVISFIAGAAAHYLFGGIRLAGRGGQVTNAARIHLAIVAGIFVLLKAVEYFFDRYNLLYSDRNPLFTGASYTDLNAVLPAKLILMIIAVICAIAFFAGVFLRNLQLPAVALVLLVLSGILLGSAWPAILEQFSVRPDASSKEAESIQRNMDATKAAYQLNDIDYKPYTGKSEATPAEVRADKGTIPNIRLLDPSVLEPTFTQRVGRENFYGFPEKLDVDRYTIDGKTQDYIVAAKEIKTEGLAENQRSWINRHLVYTHGNGFVAAPANTIDRAVGDARSDGGYPIARTSDTVNPKGSGIAVKEPRIYYGELATDYAIVGGQEGKAPGEYDTSAQKYLYQGKGGVPIDNVFNKMVFSLHHGERNIFFSDLISDGAKIMYNRDPRDRVKKKAPWLTVDGDPYPAVVDGRIQWIVDGYTTTDNYPYAQKTQLGDVTQDTLTGVGVARLANQSISYIRNSVKATVDAFDGTVTLYEMDQKDPVLKTWMKIFPGLVEPNSKISKDLRAHLRYPEDLFKVQRDLLTKYHVANPQEFFSTNTFWSVPSDPTEQGGDGAKQPAYYLLAQAPGSEQAKFQLTSALTPLNRQYLAAWVSVSSDPEDYGKFTVLRLPTEDPTKQTEGPIQIQNRFQSDQGYAQQRTLLGNQSVDIINGNLLTLPVAGGFLYVEPVYIRQRNQNSYPQLARVLVAFGPKVGFASTLEGALDQVFGKGTGDIATGPGDDEESPLLPTDPSTPTPTETEEPKPDAGAAAAAAERMRQAWVKYKQAQASGDYQSQGEALAELDDAAADFDRARQRNGG